SNLCAEAGALFKSEKALLSASKLPTPGFTEDMLFRSEKAGLADSWATGGKGWAGFSNVNGRLSASKCCFPGTGGGIWFLTEKSKLSTSKLLIPGFPEFLFKTEKEALSISKAERVAGWLSLRRVKTELSASGELAPGMVALLFRSENSALSVSKFLTTCGGGGAVFWAENGKPSASWKMGAAG